MFFEKKSFFYWLDDGIVEMSVESNTKGKWRTLDNNKSAQGKTSLKKYFDIRVNDYFISYIAYKLYTLVYTLYRIYL